MPIRTLHGWATATAERMRAFAGGRNWPADLACAVLLCAAVLAAMRSATDLDYYADDYYFVALSRTAATPFDFFLHSHFFSGYLYRPLPLALWWVIDRIASTAQAHYIFNIVLLWGCAAFLFLLLRACAVQRPAAFLLALIFAWHPVSVITTLWLSDMFDLVATAMLLAALWAFVRFGEKGDWRWWAAALACFMAACFSKELAYIGPGVFAVLAWAEAPSRASNAKSIRRGRIAFIVASAAVVAGILMVRWLLGVKTGTGLAEGPWPLVIRDGVSKWFGNLPRLVLHGGPAAMSGWGVIAVLGLVILALGAWLHRSSLAQTDQRPMRVTLALGAALVILCSIVQSPHTSISDAVLLTPDGAPSGYFYERFYFLPLAGLLLMFAAVLGGVSQWLEKRASLGRSTASAVGVGLLVLLALLAWPHARRVVIGWVGITLHHPFKRLIESAAAVAAKEAGNIAGHCYLTFSGSNNAVFHGYAEPAIKALANDARVDDCVILTEQEPVYLLVGPHAWPLYQANAGDTKAHVVHFGKWFMMRGGNRTLALSPEQARTYAWSGASGGFVREER